MILHIESYLQYCLCLLFFFFYCTALKLYQILDKERIILTCSTPSGVKYPSKTKFDNHMHELELSEYTLGIPLIPSTPQEMEDMLKLCSHVRFKVPQQVHISSISRVNLMRAWFDILFKYASCTTIYYIFRFFKDWWMYDFHTMTFIIKVSVNAVFSLCFLVSHSSCGI